MDKQFWGFGIIIFAFISILIFISLSSATSEEERDIYQVGPWETPRQLIFCSEAAPLIDVDVREKFDREIVYADNSEYLDIDSPKGKYGNDDTYTFYLKGREDKYKYIKEIKLSVYGYTPSKP